MPSPYLAMPGIVIGKPPGDRDFAEQRFGQGSFGARRGAISWSHRSQAFGKAAHQIRIAQRDERHRGFAGDQAVQKIGITCRPGRRCLDRR